MFCPGHDIYEGVPIYDISGKVLFVSFTPWGCLRLPACHVRMSRHAGLSATTLEVSAQGLACGQLVGGCGVHEGPAHLDTLRAPWSRRVRPRSTCADLPRTRLGSGPVVPRCGTTPNSRGFVVVFRELPQLERTEFGPQLSKKPKSSDSKSQTFGPPTNLIVFMFGVLLECPCLPFIAVDPENNLALAD